MERTALDYASDTKNKEVSEWLRAQGAVSRDGGLGERHLAEWRAAGWKGDLGSRYEGWNWGASSWWHSDSGASSSRGYDASSGSTWGRKRGRP